MDPVKEEVWESHVGETGLAFDYCPGISPSGLPLRQRRDELEKSGQEGERQAVSASVSVAPHSRTTRAPGGSVPRQTRLDPIPFPNAGEGVSADLLAAYVLFEPFSNAGVQP